jgi:hypothetical protein
MVTTVPRYWPQQDQWRIAIPSEMFHLWPLNLTERTKLLALIALATEEVSTSAYVYMLSSTPEPHVDCGQPNATGRAMHQQRVACTSPPQLQRIVAVM